MKGRDDRIQLGIEQDGKRVLMSVEDPWTEERRKVGHRQMSADM
jgi:hypothetical protein